MSQAPHVFAGLRFHSADGRLERLDNGTSTLLRPQVARLLQAFVNQPQRLLQREQLCREVWDEGVVVDFESGLAAVLRELRAELRGLNAPDDLIETVPRRGYRLNSGVLRARDPSGLSGAARKRLLGLGAAMVLLIIASLFALRQDADPPAQPRSGLTLAVLPFSQFGVASADPRQLDLLIADQMLVQLWDRQLEGMVLIGRASIAPHQDRTDLAQAVAEGLGVQLLIEGSVVFDNQRAQLSARLLQMPLGRILWSHQLDVAEDDMPAVAELARLMVDSLADFWVTGGPGPDPPHDPMPAASE